MDTFDTYMRVLDGRGGEAPRPDKTETDDALAFGEAFEGARTEHEPAERQRAAQESPREAQDVPSEQEPNSSEETAKSAEEVRQSSRSGESEAEKDTGEGRTTPSGPLQQSAVEGVSPAHRMFAPRASAASERALPGTPTVRPVDGGVGAPKPTNLPTPQASAVAGAQGAGSSAQPKTAPGSVTAAQPLATSDATPTTSAATGQRLPQANASQSTTEPVRSGQPPASPSSAVPSVQRNPVTPSLEVQQPAREGALPKLGTEPAVVERVQGPAQTTHRAARGTPAAPATEASGTRPSLAAGSVASSAATAPQSQGVADRPGAQRPGALRGATGRTRNTAGSAAGAQNGGPTQAAAAPAGEAFAPAANAAARVLEARTVEAPRTESALAANSSSTSSATSATARGTEGIGLATLGRGAAARAEAAAAASTRGPAGPSPEAAKILERIQAHLNPRRPELTIRLDPPELGRIVLRMSVQKGELTARVSADRSHTAAILERELPALHRLLQDGQVRLASVEIRDDSGTYKPNAEGSMSSGQEQGRSAKGAQDFEQRGTAPGSSYTESDRAQGDEANTPSTPTRQPRSDHALDVTV